MASFLQPGKTQFPNFLTVLGIEIDARLSQSSNALSPIRVMLSDSIAETRFLQPEKAKASIFFTLLEK